MAGGLPTDGNAELRMNTFNASGFEINTVNVRSRSLDKGRWTRKGQPTFHPQFSFAIRGNHQTQAFCRDATQAIQRLSGYDDPDGTAVFRRFSGRLT